MRTIPSLHLKFTYCEDAESSKRVASAYERIFGLARQRIALDNKSTQKYSSFDGTIGRISNSRGSGGEVKSKENHDLSYVQDRKTASCKVWRSVEDQS